MHLSLFPTELRTIQHAASRAASGLRSRLSLPAHDREDLTQDLLVDLLRRLPDFDPARGTLGAFAGAVLRHHASRISLSRKRAWRAQGGAPLPLDTPTTEGFSLAEVLSEQDSIGAWLGQRIFQEELEIRLSLSGALAHLDARDRALCLALRHVSIAWLVNRGFGSRAGIYRRLRELRFQLTALGLWPRETKLDRAE